MVRVYLTGGLRVEGPDGAIVDADLPGGQGRVAFAALAVSRRPIARDELAEIVWDGDIPAKWDGALSAVVSRIRSLLGRTGLDGKSLLSTGGGTYELRFPPGTWVDLEDAYRRLDRAQGALRHGDAGAATADGTVASGILRRPFLAGIDGEWIERQRRRQAEALYTVSTTLAAAWLLRGDPALAATLAAGAISLDPLREIGHRLLMEAEWNRGDGGAALRAFAECERVLLDELGARASPETTDLAGRIRHG